MKQRIDAWLFENTFPGSLNASFMTHRPSPQPEKKRYEQYDAAQYGARASHPLLSYSPTCAEKVAEHKYCRRPECSSQRVVEQKLSVGHSRRAGKKRYQCASEPHEPPEQDGLAAVPCKK